MIKYLNELIKISPRYGHNEIVAANLIKKILSSWNIKFITQPFKSYVPVCPKAQLIADGENIPCIGSSLVSGKIPDGKYLISSFGYSGQKLPYNINYSPITDNISVVDFYWEPSVTISRTSLIKIIMAGKVRGNVEIVKTQIKSENILIGNISNPQNIIFAHYDNVVADGALDNGGSIAVLLDTINTNQNLLYNSLFIFSGNEEVSYDNYKSKSGYGFRIFELDYNKLLLNANRVIVLDGIGAGPAKFSQNGLDWVLQIKMLDEIRKKVFWLQIEQSEVLKIFHSTNDGIKNISEQFLKDARDKLLEKLLNQ